MASRGSRNLSSAEGVEWESAIASKPCREATLPPVWSRPQLLSRGRSKVGVVPDAHNPGSELEPEPWKLYPWNSDKIDAESTNWGTPLRASGRMAVPATSRIGFWARRQRPDQSALCAGTPSSIARLTTSMCNELLRPGSDWMPMMVWERIPEPDDRHDDRAVERVADRPSGRREVGDGGADLRLARPCGRAGRRRGRVVSTGAAVPSWAEREKAERDLPKSFHYLLTRFSEMEEIFGPIEIDRACAGSAGRVNFSLRRGLAPSRLF